MTSKTTTLKRILKSDAKFLENTFPNMNSAQAINLGVSLLKKTDLCNMLRVERIKLNARKK